MNLKNFKSQLNNELNSLGKESIILLNTNSKYYPDSVIETLKFMADRGMIGGYLTFARPYDYLIKIFKKYNIDDQNLFFIDTVSCMAGKSPGKQGRCMFIRNPSALGDIRMWTDTLMGGIEVKNKFLIIDSLPNLLIYNGVRILEKFTQSLINHLRFQRANGVFASIDTEIPVDFYERLAGMCDKTIKVKRTPIITLRAGKIVYKTYPLFKLTL